MSNSGNLMLKNKWILALLILGLSGTAVYNITFFASRNPGNNQTSPIATPTTSVAPTEFSQNLNTISGTESSTKTLPGEQQPRPLLSIEEIGRQAQNPVSLPVMSDSFVTRAWPQRDPFQAAKQQPTGESNLSKVPTLTVKTPLDTPPTLMDPLFKVSAVLIEKERRFALVNGYPMKIGAVVGNWRIVAIEPDSVIVQTPRGEREVKILKQTKDAEQILNK
jgi:hypothetical protein